MATTTHITAHHTPDGKIVSVYAHTRPHEGVAVKYPKGDPSKDYLVLTIGTIKVALKKETARDLANAILRALDPGTGTPVAEK
jgi:hypothetical protein